MMITTPSPPAPHYTPEEIRRYLAANLWGTTTLPDAIERNARERPDALCVADGTSEQTFREARGHAWALAGHLASMGVEPGDRVVIQLPNSCEAVVVLYALARLGAVAVPRMTIYRYEDLYDTITRTGATALISIDEHRGVDHGAEAIELLDACPTLQHLVIHGEAPKKVPTLTSLLDGPHHPGTPVGPDELFAIVFTSGTTGAKGKGVMHTFNTFAAAARITTWCLGLTDSDRAFMPSPTMALTGFITGVIGPALNGSGTVLQDVWDPDTALDRVSRYGATYCGGATPFLVQMVDHYDPDQHDLSRLRVYQCGGAPIPEQVIRDADRVLGCELVTSFGQSEASIFTMSRVGDPIEQVAASDGGPVPETEVRIVDDDGRTLPPGEVGEICARGPCRMLGYLDDPVRTAEAIDSDGWVRSGDLGRLDERGFLRVTGRKKDLIIRGGVNVAPQEIEELVLSHPDVAAVAVIGVPDRVLGERICAVVVPTSGAKPTLEYLVAHLRQRRVSTWKLPERLELVDQLPTTATGKVQKFLLREWFAS